VPGACPCGRNLPRLSYLQGRTSSWLDLGGGRTLHPQALRGTVLREETAVWRFQIVQEQRRRFLFRLVVDPKCDRAALEQRIGSRFAAIVGPDVAYRVEFADDLPREPSGKVSPIIPLGAPAPRTAPGSRDLAPPR
jgi:phenylacetate-coenzyme A ligase PaaK-like adenylate-forming protein